MKKHVRFAVLFVILFFAGTSWAQQPKPVTPPAKPAASTPAPATAKPADPPAVPPVLSEEQWKAIRNMQWHAAKARIEADNAQQAAAQKTQEMNVILGQLMQVESTVCGDPAKFHLDDDNMVCVAGPPPGPGAPPTVTPAIPAVGVPGGHQAIGFAKDAQKKEEKKKPGA